MSFSHSLVSRSLFPLRLLIFLIFLVSFGKSQKETLQVKVGVVLNTNVTLVDLSLRAINMSLSEFYKTNKDFKTRIVLHIRDSKQTVVGAAASGTQSFLVNLHGSCMKVDLLYIFTILEIIKVNYVLMIVIYYNYYVLFYFIFNFLHVFIRNKFQLLKHYS